MLGGHSHSLLATAAADSLTRIARDRENAPHRLKPLLAYIEENLFDPSLDVNHLKRSCGVRDNSVPIQFHSAVGRPPHGYIEDRRLETACRLLSDTDLKIWQIAELLGYSSIQVFSRAFSRWSGQRPTSYRKKQRGRVRMAAEEVMAAAPTAHGAAPSRPIGPPVPDERTRMLHRALSGELSSAEASTLIGHLLRLYPAYPHLPEAIEVANDDSDGEAATNGSHGEAGVAGDTAELHMDDAEQESAAEAATA